MNNLGFWGNFGVRVPESKCHGNTANFKPGVRGSEAN